jgi:hypothetical protein
MTTSRQSGSASTSSMMYAPMSPTLNPHMMQVLNNQHPAAVSSAVVTTSLSSVPVAPIIPTPIMWPVWDMVEDPTIKAYITNCEVHGVPKKHYKWWQVCSLSDMHFMRVVVETPADINSRMQEQHNIIHRVDKDCVALGKEQKSNNPPFRLDRTAPQDVCQLQVAWCNKCGVHSLITWCTL